MRASRKLQIASSATSKARNSNGNSALNDENLKVKKGISNYYIEEHKIFKQQYLSFQTWHHRAQKNNP